MSRTLKNSQHGYSMYREQYNYSYYSLVIFGRGHITCVERLDAGRWLIACAYYSFAHLAFDLNKVDRVQVCAVWMMTKKLNG